MNEKVSRSQRLFFGVLILALLGTQIWVWNAYIKNRFIPKRWGVVVPGAVYRSGQLSKELIESTLLNHRIQLVIDLTLEDRDDPDQEVERKTVSALGIEYVRFPLQGDGRGDVRSYALAIAAMVNAQAQGKPALVHCAAGVQRTGAVVAAYRLLVENKNTSEVYKELVHNDWDPKKNGILLDYLNENMEEIARQLIEMGVLKSMPDPVPVLQP